MTVIKDFALPDLGEGLTESELVNWHVAVGDTVRLNQIIAEVETAKALVELPAPWAGVVSRLYVEPGVTVSVGDPIVAFEVESDAAPSEGTDAPDSNRQQELAGVESGGGSAGEGSAGAGSADTESGGGEVAEPNLVGYGATAESGDRPMRRPRPGLTAATSSQPSSSTSDARPVAVAPHPTAAKGEAAERPRATPPVRRLARERGIDLAAVVGTGAHGIVTREDLVSFASAEAASEAAASRPQPAVSGTVTAAATPRERRIPVRGVRKLTAEAMVRSAFTAPHATVFLTADVTPTTELLDRLRARKEFADSRPGLLAVVAKALCLAVHRTPSVNSRWDGDNQQIIEFGYVNLGIAAATPRGLVVPIIPDADALSLAELATSIRDLAETARGGRTSPERLTGGTISITNVGVFGVDAGTPILTPGESAILALGAVRRQPWEFGGEVALRSVVTLALSFDHRVVDGEQAARFLADIGRILSDPAAVLTMI